MVQFWLDYFPDLFNPDNFTFINNNPESVNFVKVLNIVSLLAIIIGMSMVFVKKDSTYFAIVVVVLALCILIKSTTVSKFVPVPDPLNSQLSNTYDTGVVLVREVKNDLSKLNNILYVSSGLNFNKGDIIALSVNGLTQETNIITDIQYTINEGMPVIVLLHNIKGDYSKYTTKILKVSDSSPNILPPPNGNISIQNSGTSKSFIYDSFPASDLDNVNRHDWNLELATMGPNGMPNSYEYQGQPYGNLKCRQSNVHNPMGSLEVPEYDSQPTMYGTCNEGELNSNGKLNNTVMTENQEATVSQRVDDLLFHKGNSQWHYSPVSVDTLPNDQEGFAHFLYRSPTNLVNVKYGSIFVNEPEKLKLIAKLTKATGTENGGGGAGSGGVSK